jgi:FtsZ-binding cell division protein ZapB
MRSDAVPHESLTDALVLHFVELGKMKSSQVCDMLSLWTLFLKGESMEDFEQVAKQSPEIGRAFHDLLCICQDAKAREEYYSRLAWQVDQNSLEYEAEQLQKEAEHLKEETKHLKEEAKHLKEETKHLKEETEHLKEEAVQAESQGLLKGLKVSLPHHFQEIPYVFWDYLEKSDVAFLKSAFEHLYTSSSFEEFSQKIGFHPENNTL